MVDPVNLFPRKCRPFLVILGALLIEFTIGTVYSIGNITPYLASYFQFYNASWSSSNLLSFTAERQNTTFSPSSTRDLTPNDDNNKDERVIPDRNIDIADMAWFTELVTFSQGLTVVLGGALQTRLGSSRLAALIGCAVASLGIFATHFALLANIPWLSYVSYGVIFGAGVGLTYGVPLQCALQWFPAHEGVVAATVVAGFGGGSVVFDQVQTRIVNPWNLEPNVIEPTGRYFGQRQVLERVPLIFSVMGIAFIVLQAIGLLFLADKSDDSMDASDIVSISRSPFQSSTSNSNPSERTRLVLMSRKKSRLTRELGPRDLLRSSTFWSIWFACLAIQIVIDFGSGYYKAFGQTFIFDDNYLAMTGSVGNVGNIAGRFIFGFLGDRTSYQVAMCSLAMCLGLLYLTLPIAVYVNRVFYTVWVAAIFACGCGTAPLFPLAIAKAFGKDQLALNYGLVFTSICFSALLTILGVESLLGLLGYRGMFYLMTGICGLCFAVTAFLHRTDRAEFFQI